jgi:hypothetical protein
MRNAYTILTGNPAGKNLFGRYRRGWENKI